MKGQIVLVFTVILLLFTAVSQSSYGTQITGPDTEIIINTDDGVSAFITVFAANSQEFTVTNSFEYVAYLPGSDAILTYTPLSFEAECYIVRSQKLNDLCPRPVFKNTDTHFG